jgi:hypothetical protein
MRKKREEDEIRRLEEERRRREEEERERKEEAVRLEQEAVGVNRFFEQMGRAVSVLQRKTVERLNELKYLNSGVTPNPRMIPELTSFIVQYNDLKILPLADSVSKIEEAIERIQESEEVVHELEIIRQQHLSDGLAESARCCADYAAEIRDITARKLDEILAGMLSQAEGIVEKEIARQAEIQTKSKHDDKKTEAVRKYRPFPDFKFGVYIYQQSSTKAFKLKTAKFPEYGIEAETPQKLMNSSTVLKCLWVSYDGLSTREYSKEFVVGGVLVLEFYELLTHSKKTAGWLIRSDYAGVNILEATKYPLVSGPRESSFSVTYQLPAYVYLKHVNRYNMKIATLDASGRWVDTFISETPIFDHLKKGEKSLRFNVSKQGPIAYVQPRCFDFPFKSFELRSRNREEVLLTLVGQRETFEFKITSGHVYLLDHPEPELAHFLTEGYEPLTFLHEMARVGILLVPVDEDAATACIPPKDPRAQQKALQDISYLVSSFYIRASPFNSRLGPERTFAKIR